MSAPYQARRFSANGNTFVGAIEGRQWAIWQLNRKDPSTGFQVRNGRTNRNLDFVIERFLREPRD